MTSWEVWECDLGHGAHPVVIVSHPARAANKDIIELQGKRREPCRQCLKLNRARGTPPGA